MIGVDAGVFFCSIAVIPKRKHLICRLSALVCSKAYVSSHLIYYPLHITLSLSMYTLLIDCLLIALAVPKFSRNGDWPRTWAQGPRSWVPQVPDNSSLALLLGPRPISIMAEHNASRGINRQSFGKQKAIYDKYYIHYQCKWLPVAYCLLPIA